MPRIQTNGIETHYIRLGDGSDVVMLHGFLGNLAVWHLNIVPELRKELRVTTYDLRGHGYSQVTPNGYSSEGLAADLKALLDELGIEKTHLVGHSYGADVCLHFALLHPDRVGRLIALEPGLAALVHQRKAEDWEGWSYWVSKLGEVGVSVPEDKKSDLNYLLNLSLETPKFFGPARGLPRKREPLLNLINNTTLIRDYEEVGSMTLDAVRTISAPVLLAYGENSNFLGSFEVLRKALPNVYPILLPGGEHFGPLEMPELLTEHIRNFLAEELEAQEMAAVGGQRG